MSTQPVTFMTPGDRIVINGFQIATDFLYVGTMMRGANGMADPCLISPSPNQNVASGDPDIEAKLFRYYPSYRDLPAKSRLAFLTWLSDGRRDPSYGVGYVFIYFYGLERALLVDRKIEYRTAIRREIAELQAAYWHSKSFRGYAKKLLDFDSLANDPDLPDPQDMLSREGIELAVAARAATGRPITIDDLFKLALTKEPGGNNIIEHCWEEFRSAYQAEIGAVAQKHFPVDIDRWRDKVTAVVTCSSACHDQIRIDRLPQHGMSLPHDKLAIMKELSEICVPAIKGFKKYLAAIQEDPRQRGEPEALSLIPTGVTTLDPKKVDKHIRHWARSSDLALLKDLRDDYQALFDRKIDVKSMREAEMRLAPLGLYLSPSAVMGDIQKASEDTLVAVIDAEPSKLTEALAAWPMIRTLIRLGLVAGRTSNLAEIARISAISNQIHSIFSDLPDHATKSIAHLCRHLVGTDITLATVLRDIKKLPAEFRRPTALFAADLAQQLMCDMTGEAGAELAKIYKTLGQDDTVIWQDLHSFAASEGEGARKTGHEVDFGRVAAIAKQTQNTQQLLATIFTENAPSQSQAQNPAQPVQEEVDFEIDPDAPIEPASTQTAGKSWPGLEPEYGQLLDALTGRSDIPREEFDALARDLGLRPEGAIEAINEWSFDVINGPAIEEEQTNIHIDTSIFSI